MSQTTAKITWLAICVYAGSKVLLRIIQNLKINPIECDKICVASATHYMYVWSPNPFFLVIKGCGRQDPLIRILSLSRNIV